MNDTATHGDLLPDHDLAAAGFAVLRTPLLPFDDLAAWGADLEAPGTGDDPAELAAALERDRSRLRRRLQELVERPEVGEALFLASPSLFRALGRWRRNPDDRSGRRAEEALVRYLVRMTTRPTPFGLFAGCSVIGVGERTRLSLGPRSGYGRRSRLDMDYLFRLQEELGRDRELRRSLLYRPNSSLYRAAGRLRYAEARTEGRRRSYHLVAVDPDPYLDRVLERARGAAGVAELTEALVDADPEGEVSPGEAEEFVHELIDSQLLVSNLELVLTGGETLEALVAELRRAGAASVAGLLERVGSALRELDAAGMGHAPGAYRDLGDELESLPTDVRLPRLFQVDMTKPAPGATVGADVVAELQRGVAVLSCLHAPTPGDDDLARFRRAFVERYGSGRAVALAEALDEESGVGFGADRRADASPLLEGLDFPRREPLPEVPWGPVQQRLAVLLGGALERGDRELVLEEGDVADLAATDAPPLCDGMEVMATVAARSRRALEDGDFRVLLHGAAGPSAARLLTRFCHADAELEERVREVLEAEAELAPDATFAEVVHLPEGRIGNIVSRPVLRRAEIPFLGRSGAPPERRVPVTDLTVEVTGDAIVLRSARTGRRIVPRLTTAHNFAARGLGLYRFLGALQAQGTRAGVSWHWGPLEAVPFLPRVSFGRLVLCRARWNLAGAELAALERDDDAGRHAAVRELRRRRHLPRRVVLADGDNELLVDLENPLSLDAFLAEVRDRPRVAVTEVFPALDELAARGPEGSFTHELLVPFLRRREPTRAGVRPVAPAGVRRSFPPGSEWLYARLFTGTATADRVLAELAHRLVRPALASGAVDRWFFLRYGDPAWHLRLRLHGDPHRICVEVLPALERATAPLLADGRVWRVELGTYERELERYGGGAGIGPAERLFHADSEAVVEILDLLEGDAAADARWRLALVGLDRLLADFGFEGEAAEALLEGMQAGYAREHRAGADLKKQMSDRLRRESDSLERLLDAGDDPSHPFAPALAAWRRRSEALAPVVAELESGVEAGRVDLPLEALFPSFAHMSVNRLLRSNQRAQELVIYDFLHRLTRSRRLRARARARQEQVAR